MEKDVLYKINEVTAQFYQQELEKSEQAKEYLKQRNINADSIKQFEIGYAPTENKLYNYLIEKGFTDEEIEKTCLVIKKENQIVDRFHNRVIFPLKNIHNKIVAFGGRTINNNLPKYINSPENIIYSKGKDLFGLNVAKHFCKEELILVEGYIDVISLHQRGIKNVVASLGTALTQAQIELIKQYTNNVIIAFDSDKSGQYAILRAVEIMEIDNMNCKIVNIENAKDLDEYITKYGVEEVKKLLNNTLSSFEYKLSILLEKYDINNTSDKVILLKEVIKLLKSVKNADERETYINKVAKQFEISKEVIIAELKK